MNSSTRYTAELTGVSETALLTLYSRATEARRPDAIIADPLAIELVDSLDYDFAKFGATRQDMSLRAKAFDLHTRRFFDSHPEATVVALAEGLQTSFWRLDDAIEDARFRWLTVDLEPIIDIRRRLLPESPRIVTAAQSALDYSWMDRVDAGAGVFITAEGLLMYLQPADALGLIERCANRFPGGQMLFDLPPAWFAGLSRIGMLRPSLRYQVPPMPFSLTVDQVAGLVETMSGLRVVHDLPLPLGRGAVFNAVVQNGYRFRLLNGVRGVLTLLEFG